MDPFYEKIARLAVHYSLKVQPKEDVLIQAPHIAEEIVSALYAEIVKVGAYPTLQIGLPGIQEIFYEHANDDQLAHVSKVNHLYYETYKHIITIDAENNSRELELVDPKKLRLRSGNPENAQLMQTFMNRLESKDLHWVYVPFPCHAKAQDAGMGRLAYKNFIEKALALDTEDPIKYWVNKFTEQEKLVNILNQADKIHVLGEDTNLTLSVKGRKWINCAGEMNLPDGEVFTGPLEDSINGNIRFTYPGIFQGKEVENIYLEFTNGKVTKATADKGQELLDSILKIDGADGVGEFAIGTNYKITKFIKNMLFDEKIGGTMHMALGMGIPESGSQAHSAIHWDILKDMHSDESQIFADEKLIYQAGKWLI